MERGEGGLLYLSVAQDLLRKIRQGEWEPGSQLPGVRELSALYEVSIKTITRALEEVNHHGLIVRTQGRGIFLIPREKWPPGERGHPFHCLVSSSGSSLNSSFATKLSVEVARTGGKLSITPYDGVDSLREQFPLTQCRGIVLVELSPSDALLSTLSECAGGVPLLYVGGISPPKWFSGAHLVWDLEDGLEAAVEHLVEQGHSRIGYLGGPLPIAEDPQVTTLEKILHRRNLPVNGAWFYSPEGDQIEDGVRAMEEILLPAGRTPAGTPTAYISQSDGVSAGVVTAVREAGLSIPGDISLLGCENSMLASTITPALTSLSLDLEVAAILATGIMGVLEGGSRKDPSRIGAKLPTTLIQRDSTLGSLQESGDIWV